MTTKLCAAKSLISREARHLTFGQQTKKEHRRKLHNPPKNRAGLRASPYRLSREIFFPARTLQGLYWSPRLSTRDSHWTIADLTFPPGCSFPPLATALRFTSRIPVSTNRPVRDFSLYNPPQSPVRSQTLHRDSSTCHFRWLAPYTEIAVKVCAL